MWLRFRFLRFYDEENNAHCRACHGNKPHKKEDKSRLNHHAKKIACQTCHIPRFARANPTKTWWDWSTAGTDTENVKDEYGKNTFVKKKGTFKWEKNVVPAYTWYDGVSTQYVLGDAMNPDGVTHLNLPQGNRLDPKSKIYPFKVMRGKQPYDVQAKVIAVPKLFGKTGFWKHFDWNDAIAQGMKAVGQEYSGEYGFAETESWWKANHMVAPATDALQCKACHSKDGDSRMDWKALGYEGDPAEHRGISRFELEDEYRDVNE